MSNLPSFPTPQSQLVSKPIAVIRVLQDFIYDHKETLKDRRIALGGEMGHQLWRAVFRKPIESTIVLPIDFISTIWERKDFLPPMQRAQDKVEGPIHEKDQDICLRYDKFWCRRIQWWCPLRPSVQNS